MGLLDIFLSKEKRQEKARSKYIGRAVSKYAQSPERFHALEKLAADGSEDALHGLLRRFALQYDKTIEDEQEKEWVFEALVSKGTAALPAVRRYLKSAESVSWPLRVLARIAESRDEELDVIKEVLARHEPGYERDPTKKIQLLGYLGQLKHADAAGIIAPYLEDMDEGVRYAAIEGLVRQKNEDVGREPLLALFVSDKEDSLRLRLRIAEGFAELGWLVHGHRGEVEKKLPDAYTLDREGHIKKKPGKE
jgi:HEAT repeat protein